MKIGMIGLGKMGHSIAYRLIKAKHDVIGYDTNAKIKEEAERIGVKTVSDIVQIPEQARVIWLMVPAGKAVDQVLEKILPLCKKDDIIIDGGNSQFTDTIARHDECARKAVHYLDCGTSGGLGGKETGFSLMVGGGKPAFDNVQEVFEAIAAKNGYGYMGPSGAGHYVKMIHNGIEYSILQAYAEGFHLLKKGNYKKLNFANITKTWQNGSVIRSWILDLCHDIFVKDQELENISGSIDENFTGRWTIEEAQKQGVPMDLLDKSLFIRKQSRETGGNYSTKVVAMLRHKFGGHPVKKIQNDE